MSRLLFLLAVLWIATSAEAAPPATPAYLVKGFHSAAFLMTRDQVRQAIAKDFSPSPEAVSQTDNQLERTSAITVKLASLDPGPGPAVITYIFGAASKVLIHVNVVWLLSGDPSPEQRLQIVAAGTQLTGYFRALPWKPNSTAAGEPDGVNSIVMFAGVDDKGAAVELTADGIALDHLDKGKAATSPPPTGPAQLLISYSQDAAHPDVYRIAPGSF